MNGSTAVTAERIMQGLSLENQVSNLKRYVEVRDAVRKSGINYPTVTVQTTFMKSNIDELPGLLEMAIDMGVDRFKGHHVWVTWPQIENESLRNDAKAITKWNQVVKRLHEIADNKKLPSSKKIELANVYPIPVDGEESIGICTNMICPFLGKEAWISWDGRFDVCCVPDMKRRMLGQYGNVRDSDIMDIWHGEPYDQLIKNWGSHDVCRECNMKVPYGSC
jgi:MoaA/NifB/PqqE/SkfB family radical SAM enzyme